MIRAAILAIIASPACADTVSVSGTTVQIEAAAPPAVARITMQNDPSNGETDTGNYILTLPGLSVPFAFDWNANADQDRITVTPPEGTYCEPRSCVLQLDENAVGDLWIMEWVGM